MPAQPETDATGPQPPPVKLSTPRRFAALLVALALVALGLVLVRALWRLHLPYVNTVLGLGLSCLCLIVAMLAAWRVMSAFLYKVGEAAGGGEVHGRAVGGRCVPLQPAGARRRRAP